MSDILLRKLGGRTEMWVSKSELLSPAADGPQQTKKLTGGVFFKGVSYGKMILPNHVKKCGFLKAGRGN